MGLYLGVLQVGSSVYSLIRQKELEDCQFPVKGMSLTTWLLVQTGLGATDMFFPLIIHLILYRNLISEAKEADNPNKGPSDRTLEARTADGPIRVSRHDILEAFKTTFTLHPVTYVYLVLIVVSLVWAILGWVWIAQGGAGCNPEKIWPIVGSWLSLFFIGFIAVYSATWFYQLMMYEQTDILTLRTGGKADDMGFHEAPPPPPPVTDNEQTGLLSWFTRPNNNQVAAGGNNQIEPPKPKPKPKSMITRIVKLLASLGLDILGNLTYLCPGYGEAADAVFAPASAVMLKMLYSSNGIAAIGATEEILPGTDLTPTATIAWFMENVMGNNCCTRAFGFAQKNE